MSFHHDSFAFDEPLHPLQQHPHFASALSGIGRPMSRILLPGQGSAQIMSRTLWPTRKALRMLSRGPVWSIPPTAQTQWDAIRSLRDAGVRLINAEGVPAPIMKAAGYRQIMTPATIAVLDLRGTQEDRLLAMTAKWRNALRKAEHAGLTIAVAPYQAQSHKWILTEDARQQKHGAIGRGPAT